MPIERIIDSKYKIVVVEEIKINIDEKTQERPSNKIKIVNSINGNEIPEDEPLFIFRAKDNLSLNVLVNYYTSCKANGCTIEQCNSLAKTLDEWYKWQNENMDKLKQPGSTTPADIKAKIEKERDDLPPQPGRRNA